MVDTREALKEMLGREVTVSKVRINGVEKFLADYVNHSAPATKLAADTEDEAVQLLHDYLKRNADQTPIME